MNIEQLRPAREGLLRVPHRALAAASFSDAADDNPTWGVGLVDRN